MTNEEAEQLIAELKFKICDPDKFCANDDAIEFSMTNIEKIIKRFANKPPYIVNLGNEHHFVELNINEHHGYPEVIIKTGAAEHEVLLNINQLKQLRNNCTKMLEYLENE